MESQTARRKPLFRLLLLSVASLLGLNVAILWIQEDWRQMAAHRASQLERTVTQTQRKLKAEEAAGAAAEVETLRQEWAAMRQGLSPWEAQSTALQEWSRAWKVSAQALLETNEMVVTRIGLVLKERPISEWPHLVRSLEPRLSRPGVRVEFLRIEVEGQGAMRRLRLFELSLRWVTRRSPAQEVPL